MDTCELRLSVPVGGVEKHLQPFLSERFPELAKFLGDVDISLNRPVDVTVKVPKQQVALHLVIEEVAGTAATAAFPSQPPSP